MIVHDVADYVNQPVPRPEFYVQDILPKQGVMLVYGNPKVKKSWLVQHLGYCISIGEPWLGFRTEQARVLIAQFEISQIAYAWRLKDMARNFHLQNQMLFEVSPGLMYLEDEEHYNRFAAGIRDYHPNVLIFDCMAACFGGDENNSRDMARFVEIISNLKTEHNASAVIVHHTNKNLLSTSSVDRARGHSRLTGWVDTLAFMVEQPSGVQVQFKARQATREIPNLNIRFRDYNWHVRGGANEAGN